MATVGLILCVCGSLLLTGCRGFASYASTPSVELGLEASAQDRDLAIAGDRSGDTACDVGVPAERLVPDGREGDAKVDVITGEIGVGDSATDASSGDAGLSGGMKPIDAIALGAALFAARVPCILVNGTLQGDQPLADRNWAAFYDWSLYVPSADPATIAWVGGKPSVMVLWDLNACEYEEADGDWYTAGLIVRGATLNASGQLVLASGTTLADLDVVDADVSGSWESERYGPTDQGIEPNLVEPIGGAKALLLALSKGP